MQERTFEEPQEQTGCKILLIKKKPPVISKLEAGIREVKHMKGGDLEKCSSFGSRNKLWSDLKKPFSSYLLQLREARRRREETTESYFMGPSLPLPSPAASYGKRLLP